MSIDIDSLASAVLNALEKETAKILKDVKDGEFDVPVGVSNHHVHLSREDIDICFGEGYELTPLKDLSQPGQFACKETVTICGPKGAIEKIRILGPARKATQVELFVADNFKLGIDAPLIVSAIGLAELFKTGKDIIARNYQSFRMYAILAVLYLIIITLGYDPLK